MDLFIMKLLNQVSTVTLKFMYYKETSFLLNNGVKTKLLNSNNHKT